MAHKWTAADIPDQRGCTAIVTGANSGLGFHTARELARAGARVILAVRDTNRGERAGMWLGNLIFAQSAEMGALPTLYAATLPDLPGGSFVGPDGFRGQRGPPPPRHGR